MHNTHYRSIFDVKRPLNLRTPHKHALNTSYDPKITGCYQLEKEHQRSPSIGPTVFSSLISGAAAALPATPLLSLPESPSPIMPVLWRPPRRGRKRGPIARHGHHEVVDSRLRSSSLSSSSVSGGGLRCQGIVVRLALFETKDTRGGRGVYVGGGDDGGSVPFSRVVDDRHAGIEERLWYRSLHRHAIACSISLVPKSHFDVAAASDTYIYIWSRQIDGVRYMPIKVNAIIKSFMLASAESRRDGLNSVIYLLDTIHRYVFSPTGNIMYFALHAKKQHTRKSCDSWFMKSSIG